MKNVILVISLIVLVISFSCTKKNTEDKTISIIPQPVSIEQSEGVFELNHKTKIVFPESVMVLDVVEYMKEYISKATGYDLESGASIEDKNQIIFKLIEGEPPGEEGYGLEVNNRQVVITATSSKGLFYGVQTLLQLLPPQIYSEQKVENIKWTIPACLINDEPRFRCFDPIFAV